jgi:hypothetical protein
MHKFLRERAWRLQRSVWSDDSDRDMRIKSRLASHERINESSSHSSIDWAQLDGTFFQNAFTHDLPDRAGESSNEQPFDQSADPAIDESTTQSIIRSYPVGERHNLCLQRPICETCVTLEKYCSTYSWTLQRTRVGITTRLEQSLDRSVNQSPIDPVAQSTEQSADLSNNQSIKTVSETLQQHQDCTGSCYEMHQSN